MPEIRNTNGTPRRIRVNRTHDGQIEIRHAGDGPGRAHMIVVTRDDAVLLASRLLRVAHPDDDVD